VTRPWDIGPLTEHDVERVGAVLGLARLEQGDGLYLVAWQGDEPIGHVYLAFADPAELQDVAVRKEHRRRGVASTLAEAAGREAAARGVDRLRIVVSIDDKAAQALYRKCGYLETSIPPTRVLGPVVIRTGAIEVDDTLLTWEKRLAAGPSHARPPR
jgi:ribosomal protein S18 acetylase RimI-like enzyme